MSPRPILLAATAAAASRLPLARLSTPTAAFKTTAVHACSDMAPKRKATAPKAAAAGQKTKAAPAAAAPVADAPPGSIVIEACKS